MSVTGSRNAWWALVFAVGQVACRGPSKSTDDPTGTPEAGPQDSGALVIELPTDDNPFDDPRRGSDTGRPPPDSADPHTPELYLRYGAVAWSQLDLRRGHIKLTDGDYTCAELFDPGAPLAQGVHADLDPTFDASGMPVWETTYQVQADRPTIVNGIIQVGGGGTPVCEEARLYVLSWDARSAVVQFVGPTVTTGEVELINCGERAPWGE